MTREKIAETYVEFGADLVPLQQGQRRARSGLQAWAGAARNIMGTVIALATAGLIARGLRSSVSAYAELIESQNKFTVVMGTQTQRVGGWLDEQKNRFGTSRREAMEFVGGFAAMFKSVGMTEEQAATTAQKAFSLAGDKASFMNLTMEQATGNMRSFLMGMTRAGYGLDIFSNQESVLAKAMDMFGLSVKGQVTEQMEMLARLQIAYEQAGSAGAIGDFARTMDSLSNRMKVLRGENENLRAAIGHAAATFFNIEGVLGSVTGSITTMANRIRTLATDGKFAEWGAMVSATLGQVKDDVLIVPKVIRAGLIDQLEYAVEVALWFKKEWHTIWTGWSTFVTNGIDNVSEKLGTWMAKAWSKMKGEDYAGGEAVIKDMMEGLDGVSSPMPTPDLDEVEAVLSEYEDARVAREEKLSGRLDAIYAQRGRAEGDAAGDAANKVQGAEDAKQKAIKNTLSIGQGFKAIWELSQRAAMKATVSGGKAAVATAGSGVKQKDPQMDTNNNLLGKAVQTLQGIEGKVGGGMAFA